MLLAICGGSDIYFHRIPNWCLVLLFTYSVRVCIQTDPKELIFLLARIILIGCVFCPLFYLRMIGGGDLKLMAYLAGHFGIITGARILFLGLFLGAALALAKMLRMRNLIPRLLYLFKYMLNGIQNNQWGDYYDIHQQGYQMTIPLGACFVSAVFIFWIGGML